MSNYIALFAAYGVALCLWWVVQRRTPSLWPASENAEFDHPWREVGFALLAVIGILGIGSLWSAGVRFPEGGSAGPVFETINQLLIFSPVAVLLAVRRQPIATAWVPTTQILLRLGIGLALAIAALGVYLVARGQLAACTEAVAGVYRPSNAPLFVQVFLEDVTIAVLAVRIRAAIGTRWTAALVASLFAAGHIPAFLARGIELADLSSLVLDTALGAGIIAVLLRARDITWFWMIHSALDLVQRVEFGP